MRKKREEENDHLERRWERQTIEKRLVEMQGALKEVAKRRVQQQQREELPVRVAKELELVERDFAHYERVVRGFRLELSDSESGD